MTPEIYLDQFTCVIAANKITLLTSSSNDIPANVPLNIKIIGAKNPNYEGNTALLGQFSMTMTHPNGFLINQGNFPPVTFLKQ